MALVAAFDGDGDDGAITFELDRVFDRIDEPALAFRAFERGNAALDRDLTNGRFDGGNYAKMVDDID